MFALIFALGAQGVSAQFGLPNFGNAFALLENAEKAASEVTCDIDGTVRLSGNTQNIITLKISYTSNGVLDPIFYDMQVLGSQGMLLEKSAVVAITEPAGFLDLGGGETSVEVAFDTTTNDDVAVQASIGSKQCTKRVFNKVVPAAFGFDLGNLLNPDLSIEPVVPNFNGEAQEENSDNNNPANPGIEIDPDALVPPQPDLSGIGENNGDDDNANAEQAEAGEGEAAGQAQDDAIVPPGELPSCRVVAEARKDVESFDILSAIAYENIPAGEYTFTLAAGEPGSDAIQTQEGTMRLEGNGFILDDDEAFDFSFTRNEDGQTLVVNAIIEALVCESALFIDLDAPSAAGIPDLPGEDGEIEEVRVLPEGANQDDILVLDKLGLDADDDDEFETKDFILYGLGGLIVILLGANLFMKRKETPTQS